MIGHNRLVKRFVRGHYYLLSQGSDVCVGMFESRERTRKHPTWHFKHLASHFGAGDHFSFWRLDIWDITELRLEDLSAYLGLRHVSNEMHRVFSGTPVRRHAKVATARRLQCTHT